MAQPGVLRYMFVRPIVSAGKARAFPLLTAPLDVQVVLPKCHASRVSTFICLAEFCGHCVAFNANILQLMYEYWD